MRNTRTVGIYRMLLVTYPRRFRDEYRQDMTLLFAEQLRDEPTTRVLARVAVDLATTIPARHLEAHMNRLPNSTVAVVFAALSAAGLAFAILAGSNLGMAGLGLGVSAVAAVLAASSWHSARAVTAARPASADWWHVLLSGVGVLIATIVAVNVSGEVPEGWWLPMMLTLLAGVMTTATGLILGVAHLSTNRARSGVVLRRPVGGMRRAISRPLSNVRQSTDSRTRAVGEPAKPGVPRKEAAERCCRVGRFEVEVDDDVGLVVDWLEDA